MACLHHALVSLFIITYLIGIPAIGHHLPVGLLFCDNATYIRTPWGQNISTDKVMAFDWSSIRQGSRLEFEYQINRLVQPYD